MSKNSYSHLNTKSKIHAMVMYHLIVAFLDWNARFDIYEFSRLHLRFFNTERSYWLHLASGCRHEVAIELYENRLSEILEQEQQILQQQQTNHNTKIIKIELFKVEEGEGESEKKDFDCPICLEVCC